MKRRVLERHLNEEEKAVLDAFKRTKEGRKLSVAEHQRRRRVLNEEAKKHRQVIREEQFMFAASASSEKFYASNQWRTLRFNALRKYGNRCKACGVTSENAEIHVDHIKPRSTHPELAFNIDNLQILCRDCNLGKGTQTARIIIRRK